MWTEAVVDSFSVSKLCDYFTYVRPSKFDIPKPCVLPTRVLYGSQNSRRLFPYTALTGRAVVRKIAIGDY